MSPEKKLLKLETFKYKNNAGGDMHSSIAKLIIMTFINMKCHDFSLFIKEKLY